MSGKALASCSIFEDFIMKFATLKNGSRDGLPLLVSNDLTQAISIRHLVPSLREALEDWERAEPALRQCHAQLESGRAADAFALDTRELESPLPRTFQWADGSVYLNHAELVRRARDAEMPEILYQEPAIYQGGSDAFIGPRDPILVADARWGIDLEGEVAIVTDDVPMGISAKQAGSHIKLVMLVNDVSLRNLMPSELSKGFGFFVSKPATAFSPVAVTPDALGRAWDGGKLHLRLMCHVNGKLLGQPNAGVDCHFDFPSLIAHAARTRELRAGTIIGSGTVSNRDPAAGCACIQEQRMREKLDLGVMKTPHLQFGDTVRIEMLDADGNSVFGAIDQEVIEYRI